MRLMRLTTILLAVFAVHVYITAVLSFSSRVTYGNEKFPSFSINVHVSRRGHVDSPRSQLDFGTLVCVCVCVV